MATKHIQQKLFFQFSVFACQVCSFPIDLNRSYGPAQIQIGPELQSYKAEDMHIERTLTGTVNAMTKKATDWNFNSTEAKVSEIDMVGNTLAPTKEIIKIWNNLRRLLVGGE